MKCIICDREALENYCELHEKAHGNVVQKFNEWKRATDISWKEYLKAIVENAYTGSWAREVAEQLLRTRMDKLCQSG